MTLPAPICDPIAETPENRLHASLARIAQRLEARRLADAVDPTGASPTIAVMPTVAPRPAPTPRPPEGTTIALPRTLERMQQQLLAFDLPPHAVEVIAGRGNAYPTFLARLPLFVPGKRHRQPGESDDGLRFRTSWGEGRKHGPPLTVFDEDTLIALCRLRQVAIQAEGHRLPVPIGTNEVARVHALRTTVRAVQIECGGVESCGGNSLRRRLDSLQRLAAQRIALSQMTADKLGRAGSTFSLIELVWLESVDAPAETEGAKARRSYSADVYIQFPPTMAAFLDSCYSFIDWNVRRQLTDTGKAIHRFLSTQKEDYVIGTDLLRMTIGYQRSYAFFMRDLRNTMERLVKHKWVKHWHVTPLSGERGERRHKLHLQRKPKE